MPWIPFVKGIDIAMVTLDSVGLAAAGTIGFTNASVTTRSACEPQTGYSANDLKASAWNLGFCHKFMTALIVPSVALKTSNELTS